MGPTMISIINIEVLSQLRLKSKNPRIFLSFCSYRCSCHVTKVSKVPTKQNLVSFFLGKFCIKCMSDPVKCRGHTTMEECQKGTNDLMRMSLDLEILVRCAKAKWKGDPCSSGLIYGIGLSTPVFSADLGG